MRLPRRGQRLNLTAFVLLATAPHVLAQPTDLITVPQPNERGLSDFFSASARQNFTDALGDLIESATSLLTTFVGAIRVFDNATNENDLVELLGVDLKGDADDDDDDTSVTNSTIGAVGTNVTCPGMAVLFARGTAEPGNVGLFTGPSLFTALRNYINGSTTLAIQGIPYRASVRGFVAGGSPFGSGLMALMVNRTAAACPDTKLVLAGYSQGAQVVHNAMQLINANSTTSISTSISASVNGTGTGTGTSAFAAAAINTRVTSVVLFGDPRNGTAVAGVDNAQRVLSVCNPQDDICARGGDDVTLDHLTYNRNAAQAAMFVMQRSGLGVASRDAMQQGMGNVPVVSNAAGGMDGGTKVGRGGSLSGLGF